MGAKELLQQECLNIEQQLNLTLEQKYGADGSRGFYDECRLRLKVLADSANQALASDHVELRRLTIHVIELSNLICRIERSSLGEYSWAFVEELQPIADSFCSLLSCTGVTVPPKVFVLADGGLDKYAIWPERNRPSSSQRLILTIVFPKTLKDYVLLHSILGHELGHALYQSTNHLKQVRSDVLPHLCKGILGNPAQTAAHVYSATAPVETKESLAEWAKFGFTQPILFMYGGASWPSWIEEFFCDLMGVVTFGASFIAALCKILLGIDSTGVRIGPRHPPTAWRIKMVLQCARLEKIDDLGLADHPLQDNLRKFWDGLKSLDSNDPWNAVFDDADLAQAIAGLKKILTPCKPSLCPDTDLDRTRELVASLERFVPPCGSKIDTPRAVNLPEIDFREILFAGWLAAEGKNEKQFEIINKLCQHAIMQRRAIKIFLEPKVS
jgi:hypothetical protein